MARRIAVLLGVTMTLVLAGVTTPATADDCRVSCTGAKRVCFTAAAQAGRACREDCIAAGTPAGCRTACMADFATARTTCRGALDDCRTTCQTEHPCQAACFAQGATCVQGVKAAAATCGSTCLADAHTAAAACKTAPQPFLCFFRVAGQAAQCLRGCAQGAQQCATDVRTCLGSCGSPSGAFVD